MAYALLAGQPLTIVGSTGPVLAFISALYKLAKLADLPFLPVYAWTGLWTSGFLTLYSLYSLSLGSAKYLRYRTTHTKKKEKLIHLTVTIFLALASIRLHFFLSACS